MHVAPFPQLPVKALALWLLGAGVGVVGGSWAFEKHLPSSPVDSIWNKANFPFLKKNNNNKIGNQQRPIVQHRELCSVFCNNLNGKRIWKRIDTCIDFARGTSSKELACQR